MMAVQRERFVPTARKALAYADVPVEVAPGRFLLMHALVYIVLPSALPGIFTGLRLGLGFAWVVIVLGSSWLTART